MQTAGDRPDQLEEATFDIHMNVLAFLAEPETAGFDLGLDLVETGEDRRTLRRRQDALRDEHCAMRLRRGNVLGKETFIDTDRGIDAAHDLGRIGGEAAAPRRGRRGIVLRVRSAHLSPPEARAAAGARCANISLRNSPPRRSPASSIAWPVPGRV